MSDEHCNILVLIFSFIIITSLLLFLSHSVKLKCEKSGGFLISERIGKTYRFECIKMIDRIRNPDEIVLENVKLFHLEQMSPEHLWVGVYTQDNKIFHLNISVNSRDELMYYWSDETVDEI